MHAADITWNSANYTAGNAFATGANWVGGVAPGASDVAVFNNPGDQLISFVNNAPLGGMLFSSSTNLTNSYVFNSGGVNGFNLTSGASIQTDNTFRGIVGIATTTGGTDASFLVNSSASISSNGSAGSGVIIGRVATATNAGAVTLTLDGTNSGFRGQYGNIVSGTIMQGRGSTFAAATSGNTTMTVGSNASLAVGQFIYGNANIAAGTTITAISGNSVTLSAAAIGTGNVTSTSYADAGTSLQLVKNGTGTWVLGSANTYAGGTTINAGTLVVSNATAMGTTGAITIGGNSTIITTAALTDPSSRITINDGATLTFDTAGNSQTWSSVLGNSGGNNTAGLTKTGLGQLGLTLANGAKQTYKGDTTINAGLLFVNGASQTSNFSNLIDSSSRLVLGGGSFYYSGNSTVTSNQTFASTILNPAVSEFRAAAGSGVNNIDFGTITRNAGGLLNITTASNFFYAATGTTNSAGGLVKGVINGNDFVRNNGTNLVASSYTTTNNASAWTSPTANYTTNGTVTGSVGNATINSLRFNSASNQNVTITGTLAVNDGILFTSNIAANSSQVSGGNLTGPSGGGDLIIVNNNNRNQLGHSTISSTIVDNGGATGLVLLNSGTSGNTMYLTGNNSYTGNTTIGGGTNNSSGSHIVLVGGAAGASIGSVGATVLVNGGTGGNSNILRVGNADATGDVKGSIDLRNGRLSLNRTDSFTLSATVGGTTTMGFISMDNTGNATVNLASGVNSFASLTSTAAGTLNLSGTGTYNFNTGWTGFNAGSTFNYNSGTYYFGATTNGGVVANQVINGANVTLAGGRYFGSGGGNLTLNSGSFKVNGTSINMENNGANNVVINVNGGTFITTPNTNTGSLFSLAIGSGTASATGNSTFNQSGGNVNIGVPENNLVATTNVNAAMAIGALGSNHTSTYNLSGGTLRVFGGITTQGAPTTGSNNFNWTGGTLTTVSYNGSFLLSNSSNNTLVQNGATTVMSPGDLYEGRQYTGRTAIAGNYTINAGTVAIGINGTTAAGSFHETTANRYDQITVTGSTVLGGRLALSTYGYIPPNDTTTLYNILVGGNATTSAVTGTFTNGQTATGGNTRVVLADGLSSMLVAVNNTATAGPTGGLTNVGPRTVALGGYQAVNTYNATTGSSWDAASAASWTNFDAGATASPATQASGAIAQFADGAGTSVGTNTVNLNSTRNVQGVQFASSTAAKNYDIVNAGSGALILDNTANNAAATLVDGSADGNANSIGVPITLNSNLSATVTNAGTTLTVSGIMSGSGRSVTKLGAGTLVLTGSNTYTGSTTISAGTLQLGNGGTTGSLSASSAIVNNGTLAFNRSDTVTQGTDFASSISGTGSLTKLGTGSVVLNGANTYTGTTTVSAGTLALTGTGSINNSTSLVIGNTAGTKFDVTGLSGDVSLSSAITFNLGATTGSNGLFDATGKAFSYGSQNITFAFSTGLAEGSYTYNIFDFASQSGSLNAINFTGGYTGSTDWSALTGSGYTLDNATFTFDAANGVLSVTAVPEPSTYALGVLGLLGLLMLARNRRRAMQ